MHESPSLWHFLVWSGPYIIDSLIEFKGNSTMSKYEQEATVILIFIIVKSFVIIEH